MKKARVASSAPRLRRAVDPDGAEPTAFRIGNDLATCGGAVDLRILAELARIAPAFFMANTALATSAGSGLLGAIRAKGPSVISVTYGVSYAPHNALK